MNRVRRLVSQTKKFVTESCQQAARHAMQVMGGIGYTNVFPVERIVRDLQLASIWTGTNEVMSMITAHEWYDEYEQAQGRRRPARPRDGRPVRHRRGGKSLRVSGAYSFGCLCLYPCSDSESRRFTR